ncbi:BTAD domain-containing putative transcriptional regulator [Streptomyces sp. ISL-11]|uniref:AfsR/SARP family transcriptional regulator n=1 Tax=Streptomyces sp. ISL-11 TaxID=2819174 RepID=UPI0027E450A1|nr:BTAD domain-containing putative transcriptional regulator [Streptomyces sp. ISL-11]
MEEGTAISPGAPGPQAVLAALALRAGSLVTTSQLVDGLYAEDPPPSARRVVVNYVHRLRSRLTPDRTPGGAAPTEPLVIESAVGGYILRLPPDAVDALRFGRLTAQARLAAADGAPAVAVAVLEEALGMWRGPALAGLSGPYADTQRRTLTEQRASAVEHYLELLLACGRHADAIPGILRALDVHPYRERLHGALMLALYRSGRTADALAAYDRARRVLKEELGIDTGPELKAAHAAILAGEAAALSDAPVSAPLPAAPTMRPPVTETSVPAQLPAPPADFTGRRDQAAALAAALTEGTHAVAVVTGMGGVGKTSLAVRTAHDVVESFPDGQLYAELRGADGAPVDPADVLSGFLTALGVPPARIPARLADRAALFRSTVSGRAVLVVLDNAVGVDRLQPLLPGAPECAVLITARALTAMPATFTLPLDGLGRRDAVDLIGRIAGPRRAAEEPEAVSALAAACGHLPLALRVTAARLAARPAWTVAALLERMSDEARLLGELRAGDLAVEAAFEMSFSQLGSAHARAFMLLSIPHRAEWDVEAAAALLCLPEADAEDVLEALVDAALLETWAPGRYRFHDLVGVYARTKARTGLTAAQRREAVLLALDFLCAGVVSAVEETQPLGKPLTSTTHPRRTAGPDVGTGTVAVSWVGVILPALTALVEQAAVTGDPDAVALSVDILALMPCFEESVPLASLVRAAGDLVPAARAHCGEDIIGTAHYAAGVIHRKHAAFEESRAHLLKVLELFGDAPSVTDTRRYLAVLFALSMLAEIALECGEHEPARAFAERSVALAEATGDRRLTARRRTVLVQVEVRDPGCRGELARIGAECRALAEVFTGDEDREWLNTVMMTEALSHSYDGRHTDAVRRYTEVLERTRVSGHARIETECRYRLAEALLAAGDTAAALDHARRALDGARLTRENLLMARSHQALGQALSASGGHGEAAGHLDRAAALYRELGLRADAEAMSALTDRAEGAADPAP